MIQSWFFTICTFLINLRLKSSIITRIKITYGANVLNIFRRCEKLSFKLNKRRLDLTFLQNCDSYNISPRFLNFKLSTVHLQNSIVKRKAQKQFLLFEINHQKRLLRQTEKEKSNLFGQLRGFVSFIDYICITTFIHRRGLIDQQLIKSKHFNKLAQLRGRTFDPDKIITNLSSYILSNDEKSLLANGLNFAITPNKLRHTDFATPIEMLSRQLKKQPIWSNSNITWTAIVSKLRDLAFSSRHSFRPDTPNLSKEQFSALKKLRQNKNIVILKPDKGNGVVILDRSDYVAKISVILNDTSKFLPLPKAKIVNLSIRLEEKLQADLRKLRAENLNDEFYTNVYPTGTKVGRLYGLPKIHKQHIPLRPILSANSMHNFQLAKSLVPILTPLCENEYSLKDCFTFVNFVSSLKGSNNHFMASVDVENLFTNIPVQETIEIVLNKLFTTPNTVVLGLNKNNFRIILDLAVRNTYFSFDNKIFHQLDGVSMGSPLGPIFANIFLSHHEKKWLSDCPIHFKPKIYKRYVDDTFLLFSNINDAENFTNYLNSQHPNMNFTVEIENQGALSFLGTLIQRENDNYTTSVYHKPSFTGLYTNFESCLPNRYKISLVNTLLHRAYTICSTYALFHQELTKLKNFLRLNGYNINLIDKLIKNFINARQKPPIISSTAKRQRIFVTLPFYGKYSIFIRQQLRRILTKAFPQVDFIFSFSTVFRLQSFFNVKDKFPIELASNVVYKYNCNCCDAIYIGKTDRHFGIRQGEHIGLSLRTGKSIKPITESAIFQHYKQTGHQMSTNNFRIIDRGTDYFSTRIKESLHIVLSKPNLNTQAEQPFLSLLQN